MIKSQNPKLPPNVCHALSHSLPGDYFHPDFGFRRIAQHLKIVLLNVGKETLFCVGKILRQHMKGSEVSNDAA